jgi:serine/threonine-protein kinase
MRMSTLAALVGSTLFLAACGSSGGTTPPPTSGTVGGTVTGLASGASLVLRNNGGNDLAISADGSFMFTMPMASGGAYAVTVFHQPTSPAQT